MMAANYSKATISNSQQFPVSRTRPIQARTRFSFAPPTPIQLQRSEFQASSPTNSDIETSTISSLSPQLPPISRSISVIAEQRVRHDQHARTQRAEPTRQPTTYTIEQGFQTPTYQQNNTRDGRVDASLVPQGRPQFQGETLHHKDADEKKSDTLQQPYYLRPPAEPHPSQSAPEEDIKKDLGPSSQGQSFPASSMLFPAYKTQTALYSPHSLARPDLVSQDHAHSPSTFTPSPPNRHFESSFCGANSACCLSFVCPCIVYGKTQYRLSQKSSGKPATDLLGYSAANGSCLLMALGCCFSGIFTTIQRARVRKAYGIEGGFGDDLLKACCCCCCVLAQDENEMVKREEKTANVLQSSYVSPPGMAYPPPPRR